MHWLVLERLRQHARLEQKQAIVLACCSRLHSHQVNPGLKVELVQPSNQENCSNRLCSKGFSYSNAYSNRSAPD